LCLDIKYGVSNNQNLDITLNTDFAQAEADEVQVNLTRFSLFYPEKRQFFQERAAVFKFQTSSISSNRLFHSRRIGLSAKGELLDVYGGVRFVGRSDGWDYGVLDMQTAGADTVGNINHAVMRFRKQTFNNQSYLGGLFTSQINSEGNKEFVVATDALVNLGGSHFLQANIGYISGTAFETNFNDQSLLYLSYQNRNETGWGYSFEAERVGLNMRPRLGFIQRTDNLALNQETLYGFFFAENETWRKMTISLNHQSNFASADNELESLTNALEMNLAMNTGGSLDFSVRRNYDKPAMAFPISSSIIIPVGQYTFYSYGLSYTMSETSNWRVNPSVTLGDYYDGKQIQFSINPIWNLSRYLEISGIYIYNKIDFESRNQSLRADLARLNILASFNSEISLTSLIQYDKVSEQVAANVRLRYNFREGHDLYLVFNGSKPTISSTQLDQTRFVVKYSYTFTN
ncbi:MAG: hypothetical protein KDD94_04825, partial [Calditrichaeota bacterium]|nr:hypothetical protein [Calditrichota bacterium]